MEEISPDAASEVLASDHCAWPLRAVLEDAGGIWVAPRIEQNALTAALLSYLDLAGDEVLLALVTVGDKPSSAPRCALTTKRIYWAGEPRVAGSDWRDPERPSTSADDPPPDRCEYLAYRDLPETIKRGRGMSSTLDLGEGRGIPLGSIPAANALIEYLTAIRGIVRGERPPVDRGPATGAAWDAVLACDAASRVIQDDLRRFQSRTTVATRGRVTMAMAAICVLVYVAMVANGASPFEPDTKVMFRWGASFGPAVVFEGQTWRLLTSTFLHFGLIHLAMNLWCLLSIGPLVERFFGHLGFAALYLISGLGGSIASLCVHPGYICAGASGAVFGVFGGLLGYLAVRRADVPAIVLRPMRKGVLGFLAYNVIFGLMSPKIDMAGHLGGLVTGFVAGLLLAGAKTTRRDRAGLVRRCAAIATLSVGLTLAAHQAIGYAGHRMRDDPTLAMLLPEHRDAAEAWNEFIDAVAPLLQKLDRTNEGLNGVLGKMQKDGFSEKEVEKTLDNLITDSESLGTALKGLPARNEAIRAAVEALVSARSHQAHALDILRKYLAKGDESILAGPDGLEASFAAYTRDIERFEAMRDAYFKAHSLTEQKPQ
jgi:rhomboid protease GluP